MRILFLNHEFPPIGGGGANANAYLFAELAKYPDVQIDCVTSAFESADVVEDFADNIRVHRLDIDKAKLHFWTQREVFHYLWKANRYSNRLMRENDFDFCHAFFGFPAGFLAYHYRKELPYIVSLRGSDVPGFNERFAKQYLVLKPIFRRTWENARFVVANSIGLRRLSNDFLPEMSIPVIPNGIDTGQFYPHASAPRDSANILCVSRLISRKGVRYLLDAMLIVMRKFPHATLTVVGEGDLADDLSQHAGSLGISEQVSFRGYVPHDELPTVYRDASVYVQPSFYEGMSNTILEAMSCGLPIIASGEGGREELYRDNCELVPFGDANALGKAITGVLTDSVRMQTMGKRSREIALEFSWQAVGESYRKLYDDIMAGPARVASDR